MSVRSMGKIIAVVFTHVYIRKRQVVEGDWGVRCTFAETFCESLKRGKVSAMVEMYAVMLFGCSDGVISFQRGSGLSGGGGEGKSWNTTLRWVLTVPPGPLGFGTHTR